MKGEDEVFSLSFVGLDEIPFLRAGDCEISLEPFGVGLPFTLPGEGNSFSTFL